MKFRLKYKQIIYILLPVMVLLLLMYFVIFPAVKKYVEKKEQIISEQSSVEYSNLFNEKFLSDIEMLKVLNVSLEKFDPNTSGANNFQKELLKHYLKNKKDISSTWFLYDNENEISIKQYVRRNDKISYLKKIKSKDFYTGIYRSIKKNQKDIDLYIYKSKKYSFNELLFFTIVSPVYYNSEIVGVVGFDFSIKDILKANEKFDNLNNASLLLAYNNELFELEYSIMDINLKRNDLDDFILNAISNNEYYNNYNKKYNVHIKPIDFKINSDKLLFVTITEFTKKNNFIRNINTKFIIISLFILIILLVFTVYIFEKYSKRLNQSYSVLNSMATGDMTEVKELDVSQNDDISKINISINHINQNLDKTSAFIQEITSGNLDYKYTALAENDKIGNSLIKLNDKLKQTREQEKERQENDEKQKWVTEGASKFSEIIRENSNNLEELSYEIISELVNYIGANQGGLFVINEDENNEQFIELLASYAYSRRKMLIKTIPMGVGLVGRCILEKETIFMTKIPEKYLSISSGLGEENPASLLIVPLIFHEEVFGVVELASFSGIEKHKIELVEHISESIASAISMVKINVRTAKLLEETKLKSDETASQEEEIRQNIEEMAAATDELNTKLDNVENTFNAIKSIANIAVFDIEGRVTDISDNFLNLLQKEKHEVIGKVQGSFSAEAKNPVLFKAFWNELKKGKIMELDQVIMINDEVVKISSKYVPVKNDENKVFKVISLATKK